MKQSLFILGALLISTPIILAQEPAQKQATESTNTGTSRVDDESAQAMEQETQSHSPATPRRINSIVIIGNLYTSRDAILNYIPYKEGELFNPQKTSVLIRNLYHSLKRFHNISVKVDLIGDDALDLYIIVEEKTPLKEVIFEGNKNLPEKEIRKKIDFTVPAVDAQELKIFAEQIKKQYFEKGYQNVAIQTDLVIDADGKAIATFKIDEGKKSRIRRIMFKGNKTVSDKDLRNVLFTREEWILSFVDSTGTFHPERLEADKHMIEQHYQNMGFMHAKVYDVIIEPEPNSNILNITFALEEGEQYTISDVSVPGNDVLPEEFLRANIPIRPGQFYSREMITNTIKRLELLWGNHGYIFANIEPSIQPDDESKTVSVSFVSDIGKQIKLNKITIKGNKKSRDKVIRRRLSLQEGSLLTQGQMDSSKNNITSLGYFEAQDGVNWKIKRLNPEQADLDLVVKEAKTGSANFQIGFGGAGSPMGSPNSGFNVKSAIADTNLFGTGTAFNLESTWSKDEQTLTFHLAQPWLFDKPFSAALDVYHRRPSYDQLRNVMSAINSKITGAAVTGGVITPPRWPFMNNTQMLGTVGIDSVKYNNTPVINIAVPLPKGVSQAVVAQQYAHILRNEFVPGEYLWFAVNIEQDKRNHPMHASRGQKWKISPKIAIPSFDTGPVTIEDVTLCKKIGYGKLYLDYTWYTPLIGEYDLVFKLHLFFGLATPFKGKSIPFGELFHIGGDNSVRGFVYGQIGPQFLGDTIGGKKAFFLNSELIFPITPDFSLKGLVFYDGGAGWDNPYVANVNPLLLTGNSFDYRHAVGFGVRMLRPMPMRIDWGFKLDPREGERVSELHFGMTYDW